MATRPYTETIQIDAENHALLTQEKYLTVDEALCFMKQPGIREAIENHKSNWIPNSKGGEPNCRRE